MNCCKAASTKHIFLNRGNTQTRTLASTEPNTTARLHLELNPLFPPLFGLSPGFPSAGDAAAVGGDLFDPGDFVEAGGDDADGLASNKSGGISPLSSWYNANGLVDLSALLIWVSTSPEETFTWLPEVVKLWV